LVGGDWYDAFELPDGRLMLSIGDVAGHGLESSITVGRLRQAIYTMAWRGDDPATILREADRMLSHQEPGTMVTAIVGSIDAAHSTLRYAIAGHPPPMIARTKGKPAEILPFGDPPLGIGLHVDPQTHVVPIDRDSVVAFYTDGIIEFSRDAVAVEEKLARALSSLVGNTGIARPARALAEDILAGVRPSDDAALLVLQFSAMRSPITEDPAPLEKVWR